MQARALLSRRQQQQAEYLRKAREIKAAAALTKRNAKANEAALLKQKKQVLMILIRC